MSMLCNSTPTAPHFITHRERLTYLSAVEVLFSGAVCTKCPEVCVQPVVILLAEPCATASLVMTQCWACAGNAEGFSITPFAAGHLLGGCAWRITTPGDEDIVYAVHYNHRKQARAELGCSHGAHEHCMTEAELVCGSLPRVVQEQAFLFMLSPTVVHHE